MNVTVCVCDWGVDECDRVCVWRVCVVGGGGGGGRGCTSRAEVIMHCNY